MIDGYTAIADRDAGLTTPSRLLKEPIRGSTKRKLLGELHTGAMTVVQRFGSALGLNVHLHTLAFDGVYARQADGSLLFHLLPARADENVARGARGVCRKVERLLARQKGGTD